jgi:hypothetical protein
VRYWLIVSAAWCAGALAGQPPPPPGQSADAPDDEFIEFLGGDDVGDAAWWEFLKRSAPRPVETPVPPPPPPQDQKQ